MLLNVLLTLRLATASVTRRVKSKSAHVVSNEDLTTNQAMDTPGTTLSSKRPGDAKTGSSEDLDVIVWVDIEDCCLDIYWDETDAVLDAWEKDGERLCEEWMKQLNEFNKKDPDWHNKAKTRRLCSFRPVEQQVLPHHQRRRSLRVQDLLEHESLLRRLGRKRRRFLATSTVACCQDQGEAQHRSL
jgi:hypothetical protein